MAVAFLDFEQPIAELEAKIEELRHVTSDSEVNIKEEISRLQAKSRAADDQHLRQPHALADHAARAPSAAPLYAGLRRRDLHRVQELHGDRMYADDLAIVGGLGRLEGRPVMVIGHQKGRDTKERVRRNYGMPKPEGYRKALRLMKLAERFGLPSSRFIDTPGAYPGVGAEERGQSEAIARNLFEMSMLQRADRDRGDGRGRLRRRAGHRRVRPAADAAVQHLLGDLAGRLRLHPVEEHRQEGGRGRGLGITAERLEELGLIDEVLEEPLGGAHRDPAAMAAASRRPSSATLMRSSASHG